jgi:hypothetical protein
MMRRHEYGLVLGAMVVALLAPLAFADVKQVKLGVKGAT